MGWYRGQRGRVSALGLGRGVKVREQGGRELEQGQDRQVPKQQPQTRSSDRKIP
jgi:hypothetical protein